MPTGQRILNYISTDLHHQTKLKAMQIMYLVLKKTVDRIHLSAFQYRGSTRRSLFLLKKFYIIAKRQNLIILAKIDRWIF